MVTGQRLLAVASIGLAVILAVNALSALHLATPSSPVTPPPAVNVSIGPCAGTCASTRLADSAAMARRRLAVARDGSWSCWGAGLGCITPTFEDSPTAGPWQIVGVLDHLQVGLATGFDDAGEFGRISDKCMWYAHEEASLKLRVGSLTIERDDVARDIVAGTKLTWTTYAGGYLAPHIVAAYRWVRHDYYLVGMRTTTMPGTRRFFGSEWELQTGIVGRASTLTKSEDESLYHSDGMSGLDQLLYPRLGLPAPAAAPRVAEPATTDIYGLHVRVASDDGLPSPYACTDDGTRRPPEHLPAPEVFGAPVAGSWTSSGTGHDNGSLKDPGDGQALMIVGACLPREGAEFSAPGDRGEPATPSMKVDVVRPDGKSVASAEITCSGLPGNGLVLPSGGPFQIQVTGNGGPWEVFAYTIPRVDMSRTRT